MQSLTLLADAFKPAPGRREQKRTSGVGGAGVTSSLSGTRREIIMLSGTLTECFKVSAAMTLIAYRSPCFDTDSMLGLERNMLEFVGGDVDCILTAC